MRVTHRMNGHRLAILATSFAVLALLASVAHPWLLTIDGPATDAVRGESLTAAFGIVTFIGGTEIAILAALGLAAATWQRCRRFAIVYPATLIVGAIINIGLKELIGRPRPPNPVTGVALASFPSGHTLQATLLLGLLPPAAYLLTSRAWMFRATALASAAGIVTVGISRVYLGAHWPTDVVGGVLVGVGLIVVAERTMTHPRYHGSCSCVLISGR